MVLKQELSPCAVEKFLNFLNFPVPLGHRGAGHVFQDCELETSAKTTAIFSPIKTLKSRRLWVFTNQVSFRGLFPAVAAKQWVWP